MCLCCLHKIRENLELEGKQKSNSWSHRSIPTIPPKHSWSSVSFGNVTIPYSSAPKRSHQCWVVPEQLHELWFGSQWHHQDRAILEPLKQASTCTGFTQNEYFATSLLSLRVKNILDNPSSSTNFGESDENHPWSDTGFQQSRVWDVCTPQIS